MTVPYVALYPSDFLADVGHLGNSELGIYWRLLLVYYRDGRPLPFDRDRLRRLAMAFSPEEQRAVDEVVAAFFALSVEPDGTQVWRHRRADIEIERAVSRHSAAVNRGRAGGTAKAARQHGATGSPSSTTDQAELNSSNQNQSQNLLEKLGAVTSTLSSSDADDRPDLELATVGEGSPARQTARKRPRTDAGDELQAALASVAQTGDPGAPYEVPACPVQRIVDLYHTIVPVGRRVEVLNPARRGHIRARWREVCAAGKLDTAAGLRWFEQFFRYVSESKFLTSKVPATAPGRPPFQVSLDWLMTPGRFVDTYEGKYHR